MFWTKSFIATSKDVPEGAESVSHRLMLRTNMVRMLVAGVYSYLPLGFKVLSNIEGIIRDEMNKTGALELLLPGLQPLELWQRTGRDELMGETMFRFNDRRGRKLCLGPTHEEAVTDLAAGFVKSYRDVPFTLYQIQTKYRDELRPRFGIVRSCEFIMKDAYSFDRDQKGLDIIYDKMRAAYENILKRCGLNFVSVKADSGFIGGDVSHEFLVPAESGEDTLYKCQVCNEFKSVKEVEIENCPHCKADMEKINALEVGHIFKLGEKYSKALGVKFLDEEGKQQIAQMGCYGIGVSRLIAAVIEQNYDADGIIWPKEVAPFDCLILPVNISDKDVWQKAASLHDELEKENLKVLIDDRDERAGVKFKDADLLGIPARITIGNKWVKGKLLEVKHRRSKEMKDLGADQVLAELRRNS
ncbi:MAG: proline--tRNA ligase [Candidatus Omnitrophica bacterium]|nr:proline--tRNA ligase [Candidatus Omnitrophota bacterium]